MNTIYYLEVNLTCIIILILLKQHLWQGFKQSSLDKIVFNKLLILTIITCVCETIAGIVKGKMFIGARAILEISDILYDEVFVIFAYLWLSYVVVKLNEEVNSKIKRVIYTIPLILFSIVAISNPFTHIVFKIDENNLYSRNVGTYFHWMIMGFYLIISAIKTVKAIVKEESKQKRKELMPLLYFLIPATITCVIQMIFYGTSIAQVGLCISIIAIFLCEQSNQILTDKLTGLNNRHALEKYQDSILPSYGKNGTYVTVILMDVNNFKRINDNFGHLMGDDALRDIAEALKNVMGQISDKMFLCRYGGDEFLLIGRNLNPMLIDKIKDLLSEELVKTSGKKTLYSLKLSVGVASGNCIDENDISDLIRLADMKMYEEKRVSKLNA